MRDTRTLRDLRHEMHLSRKEAAEAIGISLSYLDNIEYGRRLPSLDLVPALSDVYWEDWETIVQAALNTYYGGTYDPPEKHP